MSDLENSKILWLHTPTNTPKKKQTKFYYNPPVCAYALYINYFTNTLCTVKNTEIKNKRLQAFKKFHIFFHLKYKSIVS